MAVNNNTNLIKQICTASGLTGKELEDLKARLAQLSAAELQAELTKALSGNNFYGDMGLKVEKTIVQKVSKEQEEQLKTALTARLNAVSTNVKKAEDSNGFLGSMWSGFKNLTGIGDSSDKVREQQKADLKALQSGNIAEAFKQITGLDYTVENVNKFLNNEVQTKSETALNGYTEGQDMSSDVIADIFSGIAAVGIYTAAVAAAPFTGGASIAVGVAAAGASAAAIKTGIKYADAKSGGREYTADNLKKDLATGAFSGVLAPITGGMGGAVGKTVATKVGIQAVKQVGKEVAEEAVEQTAKGFVKTMLTNPTGYEYIGGNMVKRGLAFAAEAATDGAIGGAVDNAFRTAYDGGSLEDVGNSAVQGFVGGAIMSPLIGGGMKVAGKAGQKVFGKNNVDIDANGNRVRVNDDGTVVRIDENGNEIPASATDAEIHIPKGVLASDIEPWKSKLTFGKANIFGHKPLYFEGKKVASKKSELVKQLSDLGYDMKADSGHDYVIRRLVKNLKSKEDVQKASILFMNGDNHYLIRDLIQDNVLESLDDALIAGMLLKQGYYGFGSKGCKATVTRIKENSLLYELFEKGLPKVNNIGKTWLGNETYSLIEVAPFIKTKEQQQAVLQLLESTKEPRFAYKRDLIAKTVEKYIKSEKDIDNYVKFINTWHGYDLDYYNYLKSSDEDVVDSVYQLLARDTQIKPLKDLISVSQGDVNALKAALILKQNNVSDFLLEDLILAAKDDFGNYDLEKINSFLISDNIVDIALNAIDKGGNFTAQLSMLKFKTTDLQGNFNRDLFERFLKCKQNGAHWEDIHSLINSCQYADKTFDMMTLDAATDLNDAGYPLFSLYSMLGCLKNHVKVENKNQIVDRLINIAKKQPQILDTTSIKRDFDVILQSTNWLLNENKLNTALKLAENGILPYQGLWDNSSNYERFFNKYLLADNSIDEAAINKAIELHKYSVPSDYFEFYIDIDLDSVKQLYSEGFRSFEMLEMINVEKEIHDYILQNIKPEEITVPDIRVLNNCYQFRDLENISQLSKMQKRELLNALLASQSDLIKTKNVSQLIKILPDSEEGYIKAIEQLTKDLNISLEPLKMNEVTDFNNNLGVFINKFKNNESIDGIFKYSEFEKQLNDIEIKETLNKVISNPKFKSLSDADQRVLVMATLLHSSEGASAKEMAFDGFFIGKKYGLTDEEVIKLYRIIENSDIIDRFMKTEKRETSHFTRGEYIKGNDRANQFDLMAFNLKEDNTFELAQMLYSTKEQPGLTRYFDKLLETRIQEIKSQDFVLPQTSTNTYIKKSKLIPIQIENKTYSVNVVNASEIEDFYAFIHTPEVGFASSGLTRKMKFSNLKTFSSLVDNKVLCTSYIGNGSYSAANGIGFIGTVKPEHTYVAFGHDMFSLAKNIPDMLVEYYRDRGYKALNRKGDKAIHRSMVSDNIKNILGLTDKEYVLRLDNIKKQAKGKTLTLEVMQEIDPEFATAYKNFLLRQNANRGSTNALLRNDNWWNEVLVSEFDVCAIYTDDLKMLPEEYLIKAQEENLPIVIINN